jgi:hypothetical protein
MSVHGTRSGPPVQLELKRSSRDLTIGLFKALATYEQQVTSCTAVDRGAHRNMNNRKPLTTEEDDWDPTAEGIPQKGDPFIQQYLHGRDALISQEKRQRSGMRPP